MNPEELRLRIVRLDDLLLHEQADKARVKQLRTQLKKERLLKNPPIVTQFEGRYIVLDGATRTTALRQIQCRDAVVQVVDVLSPSISLESWNHILLDAPVQKIFDAIAKLPEIQLEQADPIDAQTALSQRESIASLMLADGRVYLLRAKNSSAREHAHQLSCLVAGYEGQGEIYRVTHTDRARLIAEYGRLSVLIVFPRYRPEEILDLAISESRLPMGVTRYIIPGRALRINIPLDILEAARPLAEKNTWLNEWLKACIRDHRVRHYQEPVFLFDE